MQRFGRKAVYIVIGDGVEEEQGAKKVLSICLSFTLCCFSPGDRLVALLGSPRIPYPPPGAGWVPSFPGS